jgi:hypothetical protein
MFLVTFRENSNSSSGDTAGARLKKDAMQRAKAKIMNRTGLTDSECESPDGNE